MKASYFKNPTEDLKKMGFAKRPDGVFVRDQGAWKEWVMPEPAAPDGTHRCQINVGVAPEAEHSPNCHLGDNWKDCPACLATDMRADSLTIADKEPTQPVRLYIKTIPQPKQK